MLKILILSKRQYTNKDLIDDHFGRIWHIPHELSMLNNLVTGICLSYKKKDEKKYIYNGLSWESFNADLSKPLGLFRFFKKIEYHANESDIILACSDPIYGLLGYYLSKKHNIPLVFDIYDNFEYFISAKFPIFKQVYRHVVRKSNGITCVSQPLFHLIKSYGRTKNITVIENAVPNNFFKPMSKNYCRSYFSLPKNGIFVGTAGAIHTNRGIDTLFQAFKLLEKKYLDLYLVLAGTTNVRIPKGHRVIYLGNLDHQLIPYFYNALDVAVICNKSNAFGKYCYPQKAVEIMACNIPIVAARVGAMKEILCNNSNWFFTPGDPEDLAYALEKRITNRETNYNSVKTWTDCAKEFERLLYRIIYI